MNSELKFLTAMKVDWTEKTDLNVDIVIASDWFFL